MHLSRRLLIVPLMLGVILSFAAAGFGTQSASAQTSYGSVQNCVPIGSVTSCIVSLNSAGPIQAMLAAGGTWGNGCISTSTSISVTCSVDSTGTMITISCSGGCPPNAAIQVIVNGGGGTPSVTFALSGGSTTTYAAPTYTAPTYSAPVGSITVGQQQPSLQVTVSNPQPAYNYNNGGQCVGGSYPTVLGCTSGYVPYFQPIVYQPNNGCVGIWGACSGGCNGFTFGCFNNNNNCFGGFFNSCSGNCTGFGFNNNGCGNNCTGFGFNNNGCGNFPGHCTGFGFNNNGCGNFGGHGVMCPAGTTFHRTLNAAGQNCY